MPGDWPRMTDSMPEALASSLRSLRFSWVSACFSAAFFTDPMRRSEEKGFSMKS